jgi:short-subunit dehydrogenase
MSFAWEGKSALVTGASSGIGEAFAQTLAARGVDVLLTALADEQPRLAGIAAELIRRHAVRAEVLPIDLSVRDGPQRLAAAMEKRSLTPDMLVNSAGIGGGGRFDQVPLERQLEMVRLNVEAVVALTHLCLPAMIARGDGAVINIASTAALQPMPYMAVYAATKAFLLSFGEALWAECRGSGVRVVTLCNGPTSTPFHERAGDPGTASGIKAAIKRRYLTTDMVVASALEALERDQPRVVRRLAGARVVYGVARLAGALVTHRRRLAGIERFNRWLLVGGK